MINLQIPNHHPSYNFFNLGKGKIIKKIGHNSQYNSIFIFGDIKSGNFMALYGFNNRGNSVIFILYNIN